MLKTLEIRIRVTPTKLSHTASQTLAHIERYDWILFTSKNAVTFFSKETHRRKIPQTVRIAAVGPETAKALRAKKYPVHIVPKKFAVSEMIKSIGSLRGQRILSPRSAIAPHDAIQALRKRGARVSVVPLYTTEPVLLSQTTKHALLRGMYTRLIFKSPSGVHGLMKQLSGKEKEIVRKIGAQCIGLTTAQAAKEAGFKDISTKAVL